MMSISNIGSSVLMAAEAIRIKFSSRDIGKCGL